MTGAGDVASYLVDYVRRPWTYKYHTTATRRPTGLYKISSQGIFVILDYFEYAKGPQ